MSCKPSIVEVPLAVRRFAIAVSLILALGVQPAWAAVVTINFDAVNTSSGPVSGPALDAYLAGFGVTLSNVSQTTPEAITTAQSGGFIFPTSSPNFFWGGGTSNASFSYRLDFNTPLDSFAFTRVGYSALASEWTARALHSSNLVLGAVGEGLRGSSGPASFTLNGPGITAVVFERTTPNLIAGLNNPPTDDWVLTFTEVPEPTSMLVWGLGGMLALAAGRNRRRAKLSSA
jgi:hypothetical protein